MAESAFQNANRRTIRSVPNPLDKSTIVSIFPKVISELKPTLQPSSFKLEAGSYDKPALLVIGPASWWKELDENQPLLEITHNSLVMAESIVRDYCNGMFACDMGGSMPGLFFVPGEATVEKIKKDHKLELDSAAAKQKNWFANLVKHADSSWARTNGNPLAISNEMRLAAQELGLKDKLWLKDFTTLQLIPCVACGNLRNPQFPICPICKAVADVELAKKLNLKFVE